MRGLIFGILLFFLGQSMIWFQTNGQFIWPWFKKNPLLISIVAGTTISYIFIKATALVAGYYEGAIWPGRFIAFSMGMLSFAFLTSTILGEGINLKTGVLIFLACVIVCIQLFWK